jgi:predicted transcriptional regulator
MGTEKKPTLLRLRQQTSISTQQLAREAGVSLTEAYVVEIGGFTDRAIAERVIKAFSRLSGTAYMLDDIRLQNVSAPVSQRSRISDLPTAKQAIPRRKR